MDRIEESVKEAIEINHDWALSIDGLYTQILGYLEPERPVRPDISFVKEIPGFRDRVAE